MLLGNNNNIQIYVNGLWLILIQKSNDWKWNSDIYSSSCWSYSLRRHELRIFGCTVPFRTELFNTKKYQCLIKLFSKITDKNGLKKLNETLTFYIKMVSMLLKRNGQFGHSWRFSFLFQWKYISFIIVVFIWVIFTHIGLIL